MFDSLGGFSEIWSRDTYDTAKPTVVLILRASLIVAMALFVTGVVLGMRLP